MAQAVTTCTSSTRPASPVHGEVAYETDTNRMLIADLEAPGGGRWYAYNSEGSYDAIVDPGTGGLNITLTELASEEYTETQMEQINAAVTYVESMIANTMDLEVQLSAVGHSSYTGGDSDGAGGNLANAGIDSVVHGGLSKLWYTGTTYTFARPAISWMAFDPADLAEGGFLNTAAGNRYDGHAATKLYWVALHELLHCLGLGTFWDNTEMSGHSANSYHYNLTEPGVPCFYGAYYLGDYGNEQYQLACGTGNPDAPASGPEANKLWKAAIPISDARKHFLSQNDNQAVLYRDYSEFGQDIYHTFNWGMDGRLMRMPRREVFSRFVYTPSGTASVVSPVTFGCLEDIGYTVNYDVADQFLHENYVGNNFLAPYRNWDGGQPDQNNTECNGCADGYPHTAPCASPADPPHWYDV